MNIIELYKLTKRLMKHINYIKRKDASVLGMIEKFSLFEKVSMFLIVDFIAIAIQKF